MKKILYIILVIPVFVLGQSTDQNWVKSVTYKQPTTTSVANPDVTVANVQVSYFDGLGRPIQQVSHKQSNTGKDIITHIEYDEYGRQIKEYLPYVSTSASLSFLPSAQTDLLSFYASPSIASTGNPAFEATGNPFSEKQLENSPLNRVFKQAAPGEDWLMGNGKEIKFDYQTNIANEVKLFKANAVFNSFKLYGPILVQQGFYQPNELYKTITKDENWVSGKNNTTEEFKNKSGQVVLKRTYNDEVKHDTYYVYDQYGNLTYVFPPLASEVDITQSVLDNLCYQYKYDARNRLVEKKLPGKQWEFIVYNNLDQPVATGPALNPWGTGANGWLITKYDALNRVVYTGWYNGRPVSANDRTLYQIEQTGISPYEIVDENELFDNIAIGYTNKVLPVTNYKVLTINFYDNYDFSFAPSTLPAPVESQTTAISVKGLTTGSWVRVLDNPTSTNAEISYTVYDYKYRPVHTKTINYLHGYTQVDTHLDWAGKTLYTLTKHKRTTSDTELVVKDMFEYSPQDKLVLHKQQINSLPEQLISSNTYDELGQLISKNVGGEDTTGTNGLQKVDYAYNIRGWLKAINDIENITTENDFFAFKINYNTADNTVPLFNGNISETFWKTATDNIQRKYSYKYDNLNRLLEGNYEREGGNFRDSYLEKLTYDKNGNIQSLLRHGDSDANDYEFIIDELDYTYHSQNKNQLIKVFDNTNSPQGFKDDSNGLEDSENDYEYDLNGNMTKDENKQIQNISYNHLNLPIQINFVNESTIYYLYNAAGQKVKKVVNANETITTDYLSGFQYHNNELKNFPHAEGYVTVVDGTMKYIYNYTDHLGNIRLSYSDADNDNVLEQNEIIEENHYYPFGLKHTAYNTNENQYIADEELNTIILEQMPKFAGDGNYNYKYNGKEYQDELGLNMYDYGARNYDPALGRWMNIDPLAEKYYQISPYVYVANNSLLFIDPTGMTIEDPDKVVEKQKNNLNNSIKGLEDFISNGAMSEELGNKLIGFFKDNLAEISDMEKSDQVYNVFKENDSTGSIVYYDKTTDKVMIGVNTDDYGLVGHELKHGYQFEKGKISLISDNTGYGSLYDVGDETEAYNRERQFKSGRSYFENPKAFVWQDSDVLNHGKTMIPPAYQTLPSGPIDINSKEGKALRNKTIEAGKNGTAVQEVYKGWQKDYQKGVKKRG